MYVSSSLLEAVVVTVGVAAQTSAGSGVVHTVISATGAEEMRRSEGLGVPLTAGLEASTRYAELFSMPPGMPTTKLLVRLTRVVNGVKVEKSPAGLENWTLNTLPLKKLPDRL